MPLKTLFFVSILILNSSVVHAADFFMEKEFQSKIEKSVESLESSLVVYDDVLGEGWGAWDPDPRYWSEASNCMTWIQLVISRAYAQNKEHEKAILDQIRYFEGIPSFGTRKHFVDRWVKLDPGPLQPINTQKCETHQHHVKLNFKRFQKNQNYSCSLYRPYSNEFDLNFIPIRSIESCVSNLEPGYYVAFGVASRKYLRRFGRKTGPMGFVHGGFLKKGKPGEENIFYHASIMRGRVVKTTLTQFTRGNRNLYRGLGIFKLDPSWAPASYRVNPQASSVLACESKLLKRNLASQ